MKIMQYSEATPHRFDEGVMAGTVGRVVIGKEDGARNFCMRVFELARGTTSHFHSHEWEHEVFVHSGKVEVLCDGSWLPVETGSVIFIPGNEAHQLRNNNDKPFVFVCLVPSGAPEM
jgi:quercetin dioxygenase-like cupin family protein